MPESTHATVAVVMPAFNHSRYVVDAVRSALAQTYPVREVIVVDDGSTDDTADKVRSIRDERVRLITQANAGPSAARNHGCRVATSDWIQFLDADDLLPPTATHDLMRALERVPGAIPYGREAIYPEKITDAPAFVTTMSERDGDLLHDIAMWYRATIYTSLFPSKLVHEIGGHDPATRFGEDYDFALALARLRPFAFTDSVTYMRRMHGTNRHRDYDEAGEHQFFDCLRRRLLPGHEKLCRLAIAHRAWEFGLRHLSLKQFPEARRMFFHALRNNPAKLGAWKGLFHALARRTG